MHRLCLAALVAATPISASAATIFANTVIEYSEPTSFPTGADPFDASSNATTRAAAYNGIPNGRDDGFEYEEVDLKVGTVTTDTPVTDGDDTTYLSLPDDAFVVLGFSGGFFFDGPGEDLFIDEIGAAAETAEVSISSDFGTTFTSVGTVFGNQTNTIDLASVTGLTAGTLYNAVRIEGTSNGGSSPGFDLTYVEALEGSAIPPVPVPAALPLLLAGLGGIAALRRFR